MHSKVSVQFFDCVSTSRPLSVNGRGHLRQKKHNKPPYMKKLLYLLPIIILSSCFTSKELKETRPQVMFMANDRTAIIKANAAHFQQRHDRRNKPDVNTLKH